MKKKCLYISPAYHEKTKSTQFLMDHLREHYDVDIIFDYTYKEALDYSLITKKYHAIIFFQIFPNIKKIRKYPHDNIIIFPMYDMLFIRNFLIEHHRLEPFRTFKFVNYSLTAHALQKKILFNTIYQKYFLGDMNFIQGDPSRVFFWQRLTDININTIEALFKDIPIQLHIHKAIDPDNKFIQPTPAQEKKYNITYSEWFENKSELLDIIKACGIYIAPRFAEGFGTSYLEAYAMGKLIIAHNAPAMNEYITHNETGILADFHNPTPINIEQMERMQTNAFEYCKTGRTQWIANKNEVIEYIESTIRVSRIKSILTRFMITLAFRKKEKVQSFVLLIMIIIKCMLPFGLVRLFQKIKKSK